MYMYQVVKKKWWFEQGLIPGPSAFRVYTLPAGLPSNMFDSLLIYCHTLVPGYIHSYWLLKFIADLVFFHIYFEVFQGLKIVETKWFFCSEGNKVLSLQVTWNSSYWTETKCDKQTDGDIFLMSIQKFNTRILLSFQ